MVETFLHTYIICIISQYLLYNIQVEDTTNCTVVWTRNLQKCRHQLISCMLKWTKRRKARRKPRNKEPTSSPQTPDAQVDELTSSPETAVDQLYAQVDKKKQKSKEKEVCPEESGAMYSVVNKPSPPQVPTKLQQLLQEVRP